MRTDNTRVEELEFKSIPRLLWNYFLPAFAGVIINSLYNIVDRIYIGQGVGSLALAGLSAVFPIMIIMMAFGMLVGMGAGVRVSINLGKKDFDRAEQVLGNAFILMFVMSIVITIIGFLLTNPLLSFFGVQNETASYATEYVHIILGGTLFNIMGYGLNNLIRSEGNAKIAMFSMLISAGTNIVLDYIFIILWGMGVAGAAYATVISQIVLAIWVVAHFRSKRSVIRLRTSKMGLKRDIVWYIFSIGFAPFSMQLASSLVFGIYNKQLMQYGSDVAIGALGVIISVAMLMVMTIISINMAMQPIVGFNHGAKRYDRVKQTLTIAIVSATIISIVAWGVSELFPKAIISAFNNDDPELLKIGAKGLRIFLFALPMIGFQIIIGNYYQSVGRAGLAAFLSLLRQVIFLIPCLLIIPRYFGLQGVWLSTPVADTSAGIVSLFFVVWEFRKLNRQIVAASL